MRTKVPTEERNIAALADRRDTVAPLSVRWGGSPQKKIKFDVEISVSLFCAF